jgi:ATP-dependent Clp protease adapter protein ClpS
VIKRLVDFIKWTFRDRIPIDPLPFEIERIENPADLAGLVVITIYNDKNTPMEFVARLLQEYFSLDKEESVKLMLDIHTEGSGRIGWFAKEIGEKLVTAMTKESEKRGYPLTSKVGNA